MNNPIPLEYLTSFSQTSQAMMQQLATGLLTSGDNATEFTRYSELALVQQNYLQQMGALWVNSAFGSGPVQPAKGDRRFASEEWKKSPYHEFLKQSYLVNARYVNDLIERASVDDRTRARMRFFARQILDALSPSNYLATNPQVIRRAMETGGDSVATGVRNLLNDLGKGRISMTDEQAFEVGRNLAITPGSVVFENELFQLIQYQPLTETVGARPLILIPPSINKFYLFDLQPANSFVRYAVEQGCAQQAQTTGERASRENGPSAGWRRRAKCREAGGRTGAPGFVLTPARKCGHAHAWAAPRSPRSSRRPAATLRCAPPEPDLETRGGKS